MKKILYITLLILFSSGLYGYGWSEKGYQNLGTTEDGVVHLKNSKGYSFGVNNEKFVDNETIKQIETLNEIFYNMESLAVATITYQVIAGGVKAIVVPESYSYSGKDFFPYVPAGLAFFYDGKTMQYTFRIKVDEMFLKISGTYTDEKLLNDKILDAINDPKSFISKRDPEYLLQQINQLQDQVKALQAQNQVQKKTNDKLFNNDQTLLTGIKTNAASVKKNAKKSAADNERIRQAQMAYHNNEWFAGEKEISKEKVLFVLGEKKKNKNATVEDVVETAKTKEFEISKKEINIIFITYLNEFPEEK